MIETGAQPSTKTVPVAGRRSLALLGWSLTFLEEPADNGDACLLFEGRAPRGGLVPPHREENHEAFYVLEGTFEIEVEGEPVRCEPGDFLRIAPGVLHSVRNAGADWGRILFLVSPGARHQRFFESLGEPLDPGADPQPLTEPPDFERIAAAGRASGIHFVPPTETDR